MQVYFVLKKKPTKLDQDCWTKAQFILAVCTANIAIFMLFFLKYDFCKVVLKAQVSVFMGKDTAFKNHPVRINMQCNAVRFKILGYSRQLFETWKQT